MPDETHVYIYDECRAVWVATVQPLADTSTSYSDFIRERGMDPAADVFTHVAQLTRPWRSMTTAAAISPATSPHSSRRANRPSAPSL